jgi:hypothetical protein
MDEIGTAALKRLTFRENGSPIFLEVNDVDLFPHLLFFKMSPCGTNYIAIRKCLTADESQLLSFLKTKSDRLSDFFNKIEFISFAGTDAFDIELLKTFIRPSIIKSLEFYYVGKINFYRIFHLFSNVEVVCLTRGYFDHNFDSFCKSLGFLKNVKKLRLFLHEPTDTQLKVIANVFLKSPTCKEIEVSVPSEPFRKKYAEYIVPVINQKKAAEKRTKEFCVLLLAVKKFKTSLLSRLLCRNLTRMLTNRILVTWSDVLTWT